jgi:hypothetical protein
MKTKLMLLAALLSLSSCYYYRVVPQGTFNKQKAIEFEQKEKILVLHRDEDAWRLYDVHITNDILHAKIDVRLDYLVNHLNPKEKGLNAFKKQKEPDVIKTVHLYTSDTTFGVLDTKISIPLTSIYELQSYNYAKKASRAIMFVPIIVLPIVGIVTLCWIAYKNMNILN